MQERKKRELHADKLFRKEEEKRKAHQDADYDKELIKTRSGTVMTFGN